MIFLSLLWSLAVADDTLLAPFPESVFRHEVVTFKPKAGHHFSLEAPQKCAGRAAFEVSAKSVRCQFTQAGEAEAVLNVCDDKKTFCRPMALHLKVQEKSTGEPVRLVKNEHLNQELKKSLVPGFTVGDPGRMREEAKRRGQPVFVMISTDWCPPCNEAKEYLLKTESFAKATAGWFKVYVDGDSLGAAEWDKVVPFRYYPSFVFLNADFQEVARYNRELREATFTAWAREEMENLKVPIADLKQRVLARRKTDLISRLKAFVSREDPRRTHQDEARLLRWALDRQDEEILSQLLPGDYPELAPEVLRYRIQKLDEADRPDTAQKMALYEELLKVTLHGEDWAESLDGLCDEDAAACARHFASADERLKSMAEQKSWTPAERFSVIGEELLYLASVAEKLKSPRQKEFSDRCLAEYEGLKKISGLALPRSAQQYMVPCFELAGRFKEAEKALTRLIEVYPAEPTFRLRLARVYRKQKLFNKALDQVDRAIAVAYGYNWFTAVLLKSDILLDQKRGLDADRVLREALNEVQLSSDPSGRNQILAGRLRAAQLKAASFMHQ